MSFVENIQLAQNNTIWMLCMATQIFAHDTFKLWSREGTYYWRVILYLHTVHEFEGNCGYFQSEFLWKSLSRSRQTNFLQTENNRIIWKLIDGITKIDHLKPLHQFLKFYVNSYIFHSKTLSPANIVVSGYLWNFKFDWQVKWFI